MDKQFRLLVRVSETTLAELRATHGETEDVDAIADEATTVGLVVEDIEEVA